MIQSTLPHRTYVGVDRIAVPLPDEARDSRIVLVRPGNKATEEEATEEPLDTGFLGKDRVGVTIDHPLTRGIYQLRAGVAPSNESTTSAQPPRWQMALAVNGEVDESDLSRLDRVTFEQQASGDSLRWIGAEEDISLAGSGIRGQDLWWWLALTVLIVLLLETVVLLFFGRRDATAIAQPVGSQR
jgi:hypothetical protein